MVVVVLVGPRGSGKNTIAHALVARGFRFASLKHSTVDCAHPSDLNPETSCQTILDIFYKDWTDDWVVTGLETTKDLVKVKRRALVYSLGVEAPVGSRYRWLRDAGRVNGSLEEFIEDDDRHLYHSGLRECMLRCDTTIFNRGSLEDLEVNIDALEPKNVEWVRPSFHRYFIRLALLASSRSNCMKRKVGAIIVRNNRIVSTGYNGTPVSVRNCNEGGCGRCNHLAPAGARLDECLCLHAEENAIIEAGKDRATGATLYTSSFPCLPCAKKICQAGIVRVVYNVEYASDGPSEALLKAASVEIIWQPSEVKEL